MSSNCRARDVLLPLVREQLPAAAHDHGRWWQGVKRSALASACARLALLAQNRVADASAVAGWLDWARDATRDNSDARAPGLFSGPSPRLDADSLEAHLTSMQPIDLVADVCSLHEELLEWEYDPRSARLVHAPGGRKRSGSYLTSRELALPTVRRALQGFDETLPRVCDPACGAGVFLGAALEFLTKSHPHLLRSQVARESVFGVDLDPIAVELCRFFLWLEVAEFDLALDFFDANIRCGDALVGCPAQMSASYPELGIRRTRKIPSNSAARTEAHVVSASDLSAIERADLWCACWFWPRAQADLLPTESQWSRLEPASLALARDVSDRERFFHWELEFSALFTCESPGFDVLLGNPPWELAKPDSRQWFERHDESYRGLSKQAALVRQQELFASIRGLENEWQCHLERHEALSYWVRELAKAALPVEQGGPSAGSFAYRAQGRSDTNRYKLFLERSFSLCREKGRIAFLVPSGIYSDKGTRELRRLFLEGGSWEWLFGFDNAEALFDIHRSYKFCALIVRKGKAASETAMRVAFGQRSAADWEQAETRALPRLVKSLVEQSPGSLAIPELQGREEMQLFERVHEGCVRLGNFPDAKDSVRYRREYDLTRDSQLFRPRAQIEAAGYRPDRLGRWLLAQWNAGTASGSDGRIQAAGGGLWTTAEQIEHVVLPLYQGVMMHQYRACKKGWVSGAGARAIWREQDELQDIPAPQFLIDAELHAERSARFAGSEPGSFKLVFRDVARATDVRSVIATALPDFPCANVLGVLHVDASWRLFLLACLNSFVLDWVVRRRLVGAHLNLFLMEELPLPAPARMQELPALHACVWQLAFGGLHARLSPALTSAHKPGTGQDLRALVEAAVAWLYGLEPREYEALLFGPAVGQSDEPVARDPRGFWRVDKELEPEQRLTTRALERYRELAGLDGPQVNEVLKQALDQPHAAQALVEQSLYVIQGHAL